MALRSSSSGSSFSAPKIELDGPNKKKLAIAGACLVVAAVLLADALGIVTIFGSKPEPMVLDAKQEQQLKEARERTEQMAKELAKNPNIKQMGESTPEPPK